MPALRGGGALPAGDRWGGEISLAVARSHRTSYHHSLSKRKVSLEMEPHPRGTDAHPRMTSAHPRVKAHTPEGQIYTLDGYAGEQKSNGS